MDENNVCRFSRICSSDLICTNFVYEETDAQSQRTYTDNYKIGFVTDGSGILNRDTGSEMISRGNAFFIFKDTHFHITHKEKLKYVYISFHGRRADEFVERFGLSKSSCVFDLSEKYDAIVALVFDCLNKANDQNTDLLGECVLLYLLAHMDMKKSAPHSLLSDIITQTNRRFTDPDFSLGMLAQILNYDSKYISFFFKKAKGICYSEYLRELRIKHAVFLMEQGITSIKNVALLSGFNDALYFSKIFKKSMGCSPKEYATAIAEP